MTTDTTSTNTETSTAAVGRPASLSDKVVAQIVRQYDELGRSLSQIVRQPWCRTLNGTPVSASMARYHLKAQGVAMRGRGRRSMSPELVQRAAELYMQGASLGELQEQLRHPGGRDRRWSRSVLSAALKAQGVELRRGRRVAVVEVEVTTVPPTASVDEVEVEVTTDEAEAPQDALAA